MQDKRRELLKALTLGGGAVTLTRVPGYWSKPVVDAVVLPAHAQTTAPAFTTVTFTYTDTVRTDGDLAPEFTPDLSGGEPASITISFAATSLENQVFTAAQVISFVWRFGPITITVNDTGPSWTSTSGSFQTNGSGLLVAVPSNWHFDETVSSSATASNSATIDDWFMQGTNGVIYAGSSGIELVDVANMLNPAFWTVTTS